MKRTLLQCLLEIREAVAAGKHDPESGICYQEVMTDRLRNDNYELMKDWPEHSGSDAYPVASPDHSLTHNRAYWRAKDKWSGEYGAARLRLLDWCITELESRDANHPER